MTNVNGVHECLRVPSSHLCVSESCVSAFRGRISIAASTTSSFPVVKYPTSRMRNFTQTYSRTPSAGRLRARDRDHGGNGGVAVVSAAFSPLARDDWILVRGGAVDPESSWMRTSIAAAFAGALQKGNKPSLASVKYILRYL